MSNKIYRHSPPAPKQVRFPPRTRALRMRSSAGSSNSKKQSTLTQMDYVLTPSRNTEASNSDDEEFPEPRASKRRKKGDRSKNRQSTLTQNVRQLQAAMNLQEIMDSDYESSLELAIQETPVSTEIPEPITDNEGYSPTIVDTTPQVRRHTRASTASGKPAEKTKRTSTKKLRKSNSIILESPLQPRTPRRSINRVVPSSETPSSIHLSPSTFADQIQYARSPLREKSVNIKSLDVGEITPKQSRSKAIVSSPIEATTKARQSARIKTPRTSLELHKSSSPTPGIDDEPKRRKLTRIDTIGDSELDPEEFDDSKSNSEDGSESQHSYLESRQRHTYDPVDAALDLDATRFGWTQKQMPSEEGVRRALTEHPDAIADNEEDREERIQPTVLESQAIQGNSKSPKKTTTVESSPNVKRKRRNSASSIATVADKDAPTDDTSLETGESMIQVPSSANEKTPMLLSPSQISTVVSTQDVPASLRYVPCSPSNSGSNSPQLMPSSPIELPPWSIPALHSELDTVARSTRHSRRSKKTQADSLADFSLPPLPPLSPLNQ